MFPPLILTDGPISKAPALKELSYMITERNFTHTMIRTRHAGKLTRLTSYGFTALPRWTRFPPVPRLPNVQVIVRCAGLRWRFRQWPPATRGLLERLK